MFEKIDDSSPIDNFNDLPPPQPQSQPQPSPTPHFYYQEPPPIQFTNDNSKNLYISLFIAFIIGFFMGKTLQPIIIKSG